ncbi:rRNA 2'-O-methyltransferase fibrillarin [Staphylothermus marinus F1]|uniref:Fibrillarin-like rRNA/tRNA 2'-O-methyltransferase n=1 Tax=Staphylothermus marinus (strain ATCC 43588 / DSM 3639 / JCM 9404 / F1) TaxID=399550 RepID=FLPA_STAMF|nr:fibrillarin-like rRNA/tRNA 2'-O-methyltransferase [Staphylothermus marinus]A3DNY7.1 RecName: Full=Fibrillarin-like rRNA/tRNA 2'-O-methyltransferase [Staphylothermus marinus F1]ABN70347.1 rRNA 2'-O-methyltransferase fibrillarin [Staphylothermus marinus F1]
MSQVVNIKPHEKYYGVYIVELEDGSVKLATKNLVPGHRVYGERLYRWGGEEYREWNLYRSKLAGALANGLAEQPIREGHSILYLGVATGTTASHISDIVGPTGRIFSVEFAPRVMREFVLVADIRKNLYPILGDARKPKEYRHLVEMVDGIYADIAQPEQAAIVADNADYFLKDNGYLLLAIKARSIDVTKEPSEIYRREINTLKERGFEIIDVVHLEPYDKDHAMVYARYKRK